MIALEINGNDLSFDELRQVVDQRRPVALAGDARGKVAVAREVVDRLLRENRVAYAVNTASNNGIYWTQLFGTPP